MSLHYLNPDDEPRACLCFRARDERAADGETLPQNDCALCNGTGRLGDPDDHGPDFFVAFGIAGEDPCEPDNRVYLAVLILRESYDIAGWGFTEAEAVACARLRYGFADHPRPLGVTPEAAAPSTLGPCGYCGRPFGRCAGDPDGVQAHDWRPKS